MGRNDKVIGRNDKVIGRNDKVIGVLYSFEDYIRKSKVFEKYSL